ncbi:MAG: hypothetical protein A2W80_14805 [Candidatus Riflebacteria bacterium GWC2_50_8]|nr:MAG: hypothetical protein A2W80_14805 [Candidatus Riflebacteria bacterium GWC2_50_8]
MEAICDAVVVISPAVTGVTVKVKSVAVCCLILTFSSDRLPPLKIVMVFVAMVLPIFQSPRLTDSGIV